MTLCPRRSTTDAGLVGHDGPDAVGPDHHAGAQLPVAGSAPGPHAAHPAVVVPEQPGDRGAVHDVHPGLRGGVDDDPVQHVPPRGVEGIHPGPGADRHLDGLLAAVVEQGLPDRDRAAGDDGVEQAPPGQLHHAGAHQRVRGQGVAAVAPAVEQCHAYAGSGEQHRGGRAGHPGADHDDVVVVHAAGSSLVSRDPACRASRCRTTACASCRAPSMKPESRRCWNRCPTT